jgi:hypothetical protein
MVDGFTVLSSNPTHGEMYSIQQAGVFFPVSLVSSTNKTDHHDITEIFFKVTLNTIALTFN